MFSCPQCDSHRLESQPFTPHRCEPRKASVAKPVRPIAKRVSWNDRIVAWFAVQDMHPSHWS
jgi:hypothetical protein